MKKLLVLVSALVFALAAVGCKSDDTAATSTAKSMPTSALPANEGSSKAASKPASDAEAGLNPNADPSKFQPGTAVKGGK